MSEAFKSIDLLEITDNVFKLIAEDWMLITAGNLESFNTMTASWGALGELWHRKVCFCFIRPTRYTYQFIEKEHFFTLSFFDEKYREVLEYCGAHSGKHVDKITATNLTPLTSKSESVYFAEARLVFECKKIYYQDLIPTNFLHAEINLEYPQKDYHRMYIGQILTCLIK